MTAATHSTTATRDASLERGRFISNRLGSALAILPLGVWTAIHLWNNLAAFVSPTAWQHAVTEYPNPFAMGVTLAIVLVPLVWHTAWGLMRIGQSRPNYPRYSYFANLKYVLQRLSALGLLAFLGAHLWLAFLKPRFQEGTPEPFADIAHEMHFHLPTLAVYILGVLAIAYHLANGLHSAAMGWGWVAGKNALRRLELGAWIVMIVMLAMGWGAIYALWLAGTNT
jgi:succinate dehydrogenase / fumarate reductase cytochrome b subunit